MVTTQIVLDEKHVVVSVTGGSETFTHCCSSYIGGSGKWISFALAWEHESSGELEPTSFAIC